MNIAVPTQGNGAEKQSLLKATPARLIDLFIYADLTSKQKVLLLDRGAVYANLNVCKTTALELPFKETKITF